MYPSEESCLGALILVVLCTRPKLLRYFTLQLNSVINSIISFSTFWSHWIPPHINNAISIYESDTVNYSRVSFFPPTFPIALSLSLSVHSLPAWNSADRFSLPSISHISWIEENIYHWSIERAKNRFYQISDGYQDINSSWACTHLRFLILRFRFSRWFVSISNISDIVIDHHRKSMTKIECDTRSPNGLREAIYRRFFSSNNE